MLAAQLCDALDSSLAHDLVLVLDDVQEMSSAPSLRLVEGLCRQAPETLHVVLVSREELDLRVDRLRAQGQVLELTSSDLAFTPEEVDALAVALLGQDGEIAPSVHAATGGWPAAVRLALEALVPVSANERHSALERLRRPGVRCSRSSHTRSSNESHLRCRSSSARSHPSRASRSSSVRHSASLNPRRRSPGWSSAACSCSSARRTSPCMRSSATSPARRGPGRVRKSRPSTCAPPPGSSPEAASRTLCASSQ